MSKKFDPVPVEEDTRILHNKEAKIGAYDVLHQKWKWEAITAESIIFLNEDVLDLEDEALESMVIESSFFKGGQTTLKRLESGFTFVNFNFKSD
jgi:hypothetical protein